jgi:hypothetical protein
MPTISIEDNPYRGRTSTPPWRLPHDTLECRGCGSSLVGRREAVRQQTTRGLCFVVDVFRCKCGKGRHIRREVTT